MKELIFTIKNGGKTEIEARGFRGKECIEKARPFTEALKLEGVVVEMKPEHEQLPERRAEGATEQERS